MWPNPDIRGMNRPTRYRISRKKRVCRKRPAGVATPSKLETHGPATLRVSLKVAGLEAIAKARPGTRRLDIYIDKEIKLNVSIEDEPIILIILGVLVVLIVPGLIGRENPRQQPRKDQKDDGMKAQTSN
jgi:hypothetical protein